MPQTLTFGQWMKEVRLSRKLSATECAEKAGMKPPVWSNWENDRSRSKDGRPSQPRTETLQAIAIALDVDLEEARIAAYGVTKRHKEDEWNQILEIVPPSKRAEFTNRVKGLAEMITA